MNEEKNNVVGQNATLQTENLTETNVSNQQGETLSNQMGASVNAASPVQNMDPSMPTVPRMENPLNQDVQVSMQTQNPTQQAYTQSQPVNPSINSQPSNSNATDYSKIVDPSKITVRPDMISPQIPVGNNEKKEESVDTTKQEEPKKNNTFSLILVFLLFVGVGAFIWYMPEIRDMLNKKQTTKEENVTSSSSSGSATTENYDTMVCSSISKTYTFYYKDDKLKKYNITDTFTSNLDTNYNSCKQAQQSEVAGFIVECEKATNGVSRSITYDFTKLPDGFTGSTDYKKDDSIKTIKSQLESNNYTCS